MPHEPTSRQRWAQFRFAVVGPLLAAPPPAGELQQALGELASRSWQHPIHGTPVTFGFSTIERWYHRARAAEQDPLSQRFVHNTVAMPDARGNCVRH